MILKGSQRSGAKALAVHLLNAEENDHVEVHELRGFLSEDLTGALQEIQAVAKGTRCRQPLFSLSLNPPEGAVPTLQQFEAAAQRAEEALGLNGQPRAMVFHEKNGRRHVHVVWSRIDAQTMTARRMSHYKTKLNTLARQLYLEHGWKLPRGFLEAAARSPLTATLAEWQAAKRRGKNAIDQKLLIQSCWSAAEDGADFAALMRERGFILAHGDRRNHVLVSYDGQVLAVARNTGKKAKEVKERLGEASTLPSVAEAAEAHRKDIRAQFGRLAWEARHGQTEERAKLDGLRAEMIEQHRAARSDLQTRQSEQRALEETQRNAKIKTGIAGLWQRLTGARRRILQENEAAAAARQAKDREAMRTFSAQQLTERRQLEAQRTQLRQQALGLVRDMRTERSEYLEAFDKMVSKASQPRRGRSKRAEIDPAP